MAHNIRAIEDGRLSVSRITYFTDLRKAGPIIPLGVIAELRMGSWRALGLIARTKLSQQESDLLGPMVREKLSAPFDFLKPEFDWAWALSESEPGEPLTRLSQRFAESLFFSAPVARGMRKVIPTAEVILTELRKARDEEFYLMLAEERKGPPTIVASEDTTKLAA